MSEEDDAVTSYYCACCGIAEVDDIKLMDCDDCDLARYCSDECQGNHKSEHKEACRQRAAELRDELLFKQPKSSHLGDCPICCLPLSLDRRKFSMNSCCSIIICDGCRYAYKKREIEMRLQQDNTDQWRQFEKRLVIACPFCREPEPKTDKDIYKRRMKRVEANDPAAMYQEGLKQYENGDYCTAFEYWSTAAEMGDIDAHCKLSDMYHYGHGVEKDEGKEIHLLEEAAIAGHPDARYNLGGHEWNNQNFERAVKHFSIAATQGHDEAIKTLMRGFKVGIVAKDVLAAALRAHKAAVDATKSALREEADRVYMV